MRNALLIVSCIALFAAALATLQSKAVVESAVDVVYCPNNCSYPQGQCNPNSGCYCFPGFAAPDCSAPIVPLNNFQRLTNQPLASGQWKMYSFTVTDDHIQLLIELTRDISNGDPDLYVRFGSPPDRTHYDFADFSTSDLHQVSMLRSAGQLQSGIYYLGVYAYGSSDTAFSIEPRAYQCPNNCNQQSGHGTCNPPTHRCACSPGWVLDDCSASNTPLAAPVDSVSGRLGSMEWMYFEMDISQQQMYNDIDMYLMVNKTSASTTFGYMDLYVAFNRFPTQNDWDYRANLNTQTNSVKVCSSSLLAGTWRVAVMNYGFSSANFTLNSRLIATCPNQCSGHGACNMLTAACTCQPGWGGADCSFDIASSLAGYTTVGTAVGLSFFFLILGAGPFVVYFLFGERIKGWLASRRGGSSAVESSSAGDAYPAASTGSVQGSGYQTF